MLYDPRGNRVLAKIAIELERALAQRAMNGSAGAATANLVAGGDGWTVADVICTSGPHDRSFEEQHAHYAIAVVVAGTFQYRSTLGDGVMTPGALMLGNPGLCYECGHEHGRGDRCVAFWYAPEYFERIAGDIGVRSGVGFRGPRVPARQSLAALVAHAAEGIAGVRDVAWEELGVRLAARALAAAGSTTDRPPPPNAVARVTRTIRAIERHPEARLALGTLARSARLSPYHFLRVFERLTGVTPHQFVLRTRLREAAIRLSDQAGSVLEVALDCGFGDVSNFNRAFRTEFGASPSAYRQSRHAI
jgi:AraC family transcriptional regulator